MLYINSSLSRFKLTVCHLMCKITFQTEWKHTIFDNSIRFLHYKMAAFSQVPLGQHTLFHCIYIIWFTPPRWWCDSIPVMATPCSTLHIFAADPAWSSVTILATQKWAWLWNNNHQNKNPSSRGMSEVYYNSLSFVENLTCQIDVVPEFLNNYPKICLKKIPLISVLAHTFT